MSREIRNVQNTTYTTLYRVRYMKLILRKSSAPVTSPRVESAEDSLERTRDSLFSTVSMLWAR
jgi:hypothetical protein